MSPREARGEKVKHELLPGQSLELLRELHLVSRDGALHADSLRKLKQVNHLVQLLEPALRDVLERHPEAVLLDAGAGNAYLGFVLYELFLRDSSGILYSVETRPELVQRAMERAQRLHFDRMRFLKADLDVLASGARAAVPDLPRAPAAAQPPQYKEAPPPRTTPPKSPSPPGAAPPGLFAQAAPPGLVAQAAPPGLFAQAAPPGESPQAALPERLHFVTALHACDTATDDALLLALRHDADHIAVVPCCQAEVAAQLKLAPQKASAPWPLLWQHPLHRREAGAHLTNVIRALVLESQGYQVTVTELTGWEHSLKNELILARRVHKESRPARARLHELLQATQVRPKLVRELYPEETPA